MNGDKLLLGLNTGVVAMIVVFGVLITLIIILSGTSKLVGNRENINDAEDSTEISPAEGNYTRPIVDKKGKTSGEALLTGIEDEETAAVIMSVISSETDIPISSLKIKSIKRLS